MKINDYSKSREAYWRACKVIPSGIYGHQGPAEGCYVPVEAFPLFSSRAQGSYLWDLDGNRFEIPDISALTAKEMKKLDVFI